MRLWLPIVLLPLLGACATPVSLSGPADVAPGAGTLSLAWLAGNTMAVGLDGQRYVGGWTSHLCTTDACRGEFRNVPRIHRRHIRAGAAELVAQDGARMTCAWVSHLPQVQGSCTTADGRTYRLEGKAERMAEHGSHD